MTQGTDKVHSASSAKDSMLLCWNWPFTLLWTCWGTECCVRSRIHWSRWLWECMLITQGQVFWHFRVLVVKDFVGWLLCVH